MLKVLGFGRKSAPSHIARTDKDLIEIIDDGINLERALLAMDTVMDGQLDQAKKLLEENPDNVYHKIATGVLSFLEATVSFELEAIGQAVTSLEVAEQAAQKAKNRAISQGLQASSFRPGAQYELVEAEAGLMGSISRLLTESPVEALKALLKLHKMNQKIEDLRKHIETEKSKQIDYSDLVNEPEIAKKLAVFRKWHQTRANQNTVDSVSSGNTLVSDEASPELALGSAASGQNGTSKEAKVNNGSKSIASDTTATAAANQELIMPQDTLDEYIVSGVKACSGLIQLIISSVPPNITKLLSYIGLKGDREMALEMLWTTTESYVNIHSSMSLLALLQFFDGQFQFRDIILPPAEEDKISDKYAGKPGEVRTTAKMTPRELHETRDRLYKALKHTRTYYKYGVLWLLQEGRMVANTDLASGAAILESKECGENQMRQVEGLLVFDRVMMLLGLNRLEEATEGYISLMDLSTWSHPLYMYMAGSCQVELYRQCEDKKSEQAQKHKARAEKYLRKAPLAAGKKKILGKKMPFDSFVVRKVEAMEKDAEHYKLDLVDAIGTSPLIEAMYFWNCHARMPEELLPIMLKRLAYSEHAVLPESPSEKYTRQLLTCVYLRRLGRYEEGMKILDSIIPLAVSIKEGAKPKYHMQRDPWAGPVALYERAISEWYVNGKEAAPKVRYWLRLCAGWDVDYELSTRVNMRITGATDRLDIYRL